MMPDHSMQDALDYRQVVNAAGDAVILSDSGGRISIWNPAAERMFGFSEEEALGSSLDIIVPERHRERHWTQYHKTMSTGVTRYGHELLRVPALHKDGRTLSIAFTVGLTFGPDRAVTGVLAVVRDETERWAAERDLRKRLADLQSGVQVIPTP